jgi:hypothetical protein
MPGAAALAEDGHREAGLGQDRAELNPGKRNETIT